MMSPQGEEHDIFLTGSDLDGGIHHTMVDIRVA